MTEALSAPEAAKKLGVGATTLRTWAERIGIGEKNSSGMWLFSDKDMHVLEIIRSLRDEGRGFDTITRRLRDDAGADWREPAGNHTEPEAPEGFREPSGAEDFPQATIVTPTEIERVTELARAFGASERQIGRLEAENENLRAQVNEARHLMTDGGQAMENLRRKLADEEKARIKAEAERDQLRELVGRPWWKKVWS